MGVYEKFNVKLALKNRCKWVFAEKKKKTKWVIWKQQKSKWNLKKPMEVGVNKKSEIKWAREEIKWALRKRRIKWALRKRRN